MSQYHASNSWVIVFVRKVVIFGRYPKPLELSNGKNRDTRLFLVGFIVCLGIVCPVFTGVRFV